MLRSFLHFFDRHFFRFQRSLKEHFDIYFWILVLIGIVVIPISATYLKVFVGYVFLCYTSVLLGILAIRKWQPFGSTLLPHEAIPDFDEWEYDDMFVLREKRGLPKQLWFMGCQNDGSMIFSSLSDKERNKRDHDRENNTSSWWWENYGYSFFHITPKDFVQQDMKNSSAYTRKESHLIKSIQAAHKRFKTTLPKSAYKAFRPQS